ncbi:MAG: PEP-CTERM sorting domain-containing protein [Cyanobacteriota bacterium]|nr:PEP-CTERM sorting domain-containing protein [Cyanobacteriota bacterium]
MQDICQKLIVAATSTALGLATIGVNSVRAAIITPSVRASIQDQQIDGIIDSFNSSPFEGLLRRALPPARFVEDRAIVEFDLNTFAGQELLQSQLDFTLFSNNSGGDQIRLFDVILYSGNGTAELSDFSIAGTTVAQVRFLVSESPTRFNLDILSPVQSILDSGSNFVGVRLNPIGTRNFPTILGNSTLTATPISEPEPVPEPATVLGLATALGFGVLFNRGNSKKPKKTSDR